MMIAFSSFGLPEIIVPGFIWSFLSGLRFPPSRASANDLTEQKDVSHKSLVVRQMVCHCQDTERDRGNPLIRSEQRTPGGITTPACGELVMT